MMSFSTLLLGVMVPCMESSAGTVTALQSCSVVGYRLNKNGKLPLTLDVHRHPIQAAQEVDKNLPHLADFPLTSRI